MTETEILSRIRDHIEDATGVRVEPDTSLSGDAVLDSMKFIELVAHVESEYGVSFEVEELENRFDSVGSIAKMIVEKKEPS